MQLNKLTLYILALIQPSFAFAVEQDIVKLATITVKAEKKDKENDPDLTTVSKDRIENVATLGDAIKHISGVQSSSFGPNAGGPVIRSLSGNRVGIYENGQSINGMNSISGNINIPFDPLFTQKLQVHKSSDAVRYGGHAIGGSVDVDTGILSKQLEEKSHSLDIAFKKGFNNVDARGLKLNINNQKNLSTNIQFSRQNISSYDIPGYSKASVCDTKMFYPQGGYNAFLTGVCQIHAIPTVYNTGHQPFIDKYAVDNWENGYGEYYDYAKEKRYTSDPITIKDGVKYVNTPNPNYKPNSPEYYTNVAKDVTPNTYKKLWNSNFENKNLAIGTTYFLDNDAGYIGLVFDRKDTEYGVPGFSMDNFRDQDVYRPQPVIVKNEQNRYAVESLFKNPFIGFDSVQLNASKIINKTGEYLGASNANTYKFDTSTVESLFNHSAWDTLKGTFGLNFSTRDVTGSGTKRYLPNVKTDTKAVFLTEKLAFKYWMVDAGYRFEKVEHQVANGSFKLSNSSSNSKLKDQDFNLQSYFAGFGLNPTDYLSFYFKYSDSQRAPEINELYSSRIHYSQMAQEEGNQELKKEWMHSLEFTTSLHFESAQITGTVYQTKFDDYTYLSHSGMERLGNRLPLKYWKQVDTEINGFEVDASYNFNLAQFGNLKVSAFADLVKNKIDKTPKDGLGNEGMFFMEMPTNRYGASLEWNKEDWSARLSSIYYEKAQYLGKSVNPEEPLPSYNLVDLYVNKKVSLKNADFDLFLNGTNLLDDEARPQNSPLKYIAPLPGRGFQLGITMHL
ncbi:TonB-dependent receptor [Acinetobacter stercoris]|uniref:Putative TonB-dependent receptor n=1 Tax=Acinetobacter stercoris TaxID=2126983 RepID=A0A2U3N495_9GAMM|nr:TonB-dependent receptor [Acinetobacter stercoris]SPL72517.1 putative TonB-dependent receptor precursor [Acinetobacter stercoris]